MHGQIKWYNVHSTIIREWHIAEFGITTHTHTHSTALLKIKLSKDIVTVWYICFINLNNLLVSLISNLYDHFLSIACKFFPFVSCKMKMANNSPRTHTPAQIHSVVNNPKLAVTTGNAFIVINANTLIEIMQIVQPTWRIWKRRKLWIIDASNPNIFLLTSAGRISAKIIKGSGNMPMHVMTTYIEKKNNGTQLYALRSICCVCKYENVPNPLQATAAPAVDMISSVLRPRRSTSNEEMQTLTTWMAPTMIEDRLASTVDPDSLNTIVV